MKTKTKPKRLITITIPRQKWYRGFGGLNSSLRKQDGTRCCLGFVAKHHGWSNQSMTDIGSPSDLWDYRGDREGAGQRLSRFLTTDGRDNATCGAMIATNDSLTITDRVRESRLIKFARKLGYRFVFKG